MTTTNQAFIKAYRHDSAQAAPASPAIAGAARPAPADDSAALETSSAATGERSALYGPRPANTAALDAQSPHRLAGGATEKQPLSSFIARPLKSASGAQSADAEFLRPGTTIASFQWPAVCRALAQQCGSQLDAVADRLVAEAEADRSLIGVLSLQTGRGASTVALCLAARLAGRGRRVILVDGNFCSPRLASWLEAAPTTGWQEVLLHGGTLADAVIRATKDRFDLLALGDRRPANALRLVGGLQAVVTAGVLRHAYDLVLIDAGAFFDATSQPIVLELLRNMGLDAVLGVTGPEPADARDLGTLAAHLGRSGCELLGTIVNRTAKPQAA
jgi:Mrp family chromosome partitioning ATPase